MLRLSLAVLHLVALGLGLAAVVYRGSALREVAAEPTSRSALRWAFRTDALWGVAAVLWLATGLWRLLAGTEKAPAYYLQNVFFHAKMGLFVLILLLELSPMRTLIRWRRQLAGGASPGDVVSVSRARRIAVVSHVEALLVVLMVACASAMARGWGARG